MYDLVIIGAAAAGSSAAIYAARRNLNTIIVSKDSGGEVALSGEVNNWPGIIATNGFKLAQDFTNHVKSYNVPMDLGFEVTKISQEKNYYTVTAKNYSGEEKTYETKTVIIASGIHPRLLSLPNEENLRGKGVTYCTVCDGPLYRGKITATVGAGNAALESALMMSGIASKVYLITKYPNDEANKGGFPKGEDILITKVKALPNIEIIYNVESKEFVVDNFVTGLKLKDKTTDEEKIINVQGVMIHVGNLPNSQFVEIKKDGGNQIEIDQKCRTSLPGIFAAGDVTNIPYKQIAVSAGQGVIAALSAIEYINKWKEE
ncbi:MAG: FAD-dependent pyridine nucleotide-disulfide oxidoreductase [Candidatus Magasanikbacteria bacterium GW2011_GWC2_37_14]|uniref:FAD-dependent pyridine nucleotide-disulfide oxidoreductase n=1 Tax=Candidatus Magasanikbacteria bacterium GW2011_GWC2_37_14 TaxID=1619046 RepID=A0A0G0GN30_9BACT|nr:MAG: FAD-dependent pyridine nucleotide-disulfide oxidoreductase [Candidatus Magasanikbacteria bacterium GW2011_GWC2_37_14]